MKKTYLFVLNATGMSQAQVTDISVLESEIDRLVYQQPVKRRWL